MAAVFVTGGATGIGAASVRKFAANGFDVAVFDINAQAVADLAQEGHSGSITYFGNDFPRTFYMVLQITSDSFFTCTVGFGRIQCVNPVFPS